MSLEQKRNDIGILPLPALPALWSSSKRDRPRAFLAKRPDQRNEFLGPLRVIFGIGLQIFQADGRFEDKARRKSHPIPLQFPRCRFAVASRFQFSSPDRLGVIRRRSRVRASSSPPFLRIIATMRAAISLAYTEARRHRVTATFATRIELDDRGIAWIVGTKVKVIEVVLDMIAYGSSPEEIHFSAPQSLIGSNPRRTGLLLRKPGQSR